MKIVMLSRVIYLGGVTTHLIDLCGGLIKEGHEVSIISAGPAFPNRKENIDLFQKFIDIGVEYIHVDFPLNSKNKFSYALQLLKAIFNCYKIFKKKSFDIIHVHSPILSFVPKILNKKFIRTIHINDTNLGKLDCSASHDIAISQEIYKKTKEHYGYNDSQITLINNGVSNNYFNIISDKEKSIYKEKWGINNKLVIGLVGTFHERKGQDILIKAVASLPENIIDRISLVFLGSGEENEILKVKMLIKEKKLEEISLFIPFQDPIEIYKIFDVMVLPSRLEGFPLVTIEAMLMGNCVIRSNIEGAAEQIIDGETGFIFENENYYQLSEIILKIFKDNNLRKRVSYAGQKYALQYFTSETMVQKTLNVYSKLIEVNE